MKWMLKQTYDKLPSLELGDNGVVFKKMRDGTILKTVDIECINRVNKLVKKDKIEHVIFPEEVVKVLFLSDEIMYTQKYAEGMMNLSSFSDVSENYSDNEILKFFKSMLVSLSKIHKSGIVSGDITSSNIIIDSNLDYNFIDFEYAFVDDLDGFMAYCDKDFVSYMMYFNDIYLRSIYSEKDMFMYLDKAILINMMLHQFLYGEVFQYALPPFSRYDELEMDEWVVSRLQEFLNAEIYTQPNDYLLDVMDYLIESAYQLPYRKKKRRSL